MEPIPARCKLIAAMQGDDPTRLISARSTPNARKNHIISISGERAMFRFSSGSVFAGFGLPFGAGGGAASHSIRTAGGQEFLAGMPPGNPPAVFR